MGEGRRDGAHDVDGTAGLLVVGLVSGQGVPNWPAHLGSRDVGNEKLGTTLCTTSEECPMGFFCGIPPDVFAMLHMWERDAGLRFFCIPRLKAGQFCDPELSDGCRKGLKCLIESPPEDPAFLPEYKFHRCQHPEGEKPRHVGGDKPIGH